MSPPPMAATHHSDFEDDGYEYGGTAGGGNSSAPERIVRKRSSKACDNCRKAKCKCERAGPNEPCRNCILMGQDCTFLGPSRKRGPPKGYIDAIESRLHQMEALLGTLIASSDSRAQTLLADLSQDALARDIFSKVDQSPFGSQRKRTETDSRQPGSDGAGHSRKSSRTHLNPSDPSSYDPHAWQDDLASFIATSSSAKPSQGPSTFSLNDNTERVRLIPGQPKSMSNLQLETSISSDPNAPSSSIHAYESPHQRRRLDSAYSPQWNTHADGGRGTGSAGSGSPSAALAYRSSQPIDSDDSDSEEFTDAVGQLSLDEHKQVRYHGKASGLHLLASAGDRLDNRHEGGLWRFPGARVWPPVEKYTEKEMRGKVKIEECEQAVLAILPSLKEQEELLELYWTYVHPSLPVVYKSQFMKDFYARQHSEEAKQRLPTLLLIAILAAAARCSNKVPPPTDGMMWSAGDSFFEGAKLLLDQSYAVCKASTVQALLLMSYREIGIGAMAQAWLYVGMAVRMAQDIGFHRSVEKWQPAGANLFTPGEKAVRCRVWHSCVIMDKYVSAYIGRPVSISERDFDTNLPEEDEEEELWAPHPSVPAGGEDDKRPYTPVPGRIMSCFNANAALSAILGSVVTTFYSIRPDHSKSKHHERATIEERLNKWYHDLPEHLCFDTSSKMRVPPPHVLRLHLNFWCTMLLLHRPGIKFRTRHTSPVSDLDDGSGQNSQRSYGMCVSAANHISSIVTVYGETFSLRRSSAFLSYYIFTASIMHVTTLLITPSDIQASLNLQICMDALKKMEVVWPSANRAWELLHGVRVDIHEAERLRSENRQDRHKRMADEDPEVELVRGVVSQASAVNRHLRESPPRHGATGTSPMIMFNSARQEFAHDGITAVPPRQSGNAHYIPDYTRWPAAQDLPYPHESRNFQPSPVHSPPQSQQMPPQQQPQNVNLANAYGTGAQPHATQAQYSGIYIPTGILTGQSQSNPRFAPSNYWTDYPNNDFLANPAILSSSLYDIPVYPSSNSLTMQLPSDPSFAANYMRTRPMDPNPSTFQFCA